MKNLEYLAYIIVILLFLYAIWFVAKHSEPVSFADLMTFGGVLISGAGILFSVVFERVNNAELKFDSRLNKIESKVDDAVKDLHFIKGKLDSKQQA